ncbi:CBS domain-containing protein [Shewanella sp. 0m-4]
MRNLELFSTASIDHLMWSTKEYETNLNESALTIFTDFDHTQPMVVDASTTAINTAEIMEKTHAFMRLVVDKDNKFLGVISKHELSPHRMMKLAAKHSMHINELQVTDMMVARDDLMALDFQEVLTANVSDVVRTLQENGLHHMLVIDHQKHHIRGLISANDVARKLNVPINIQQPPSFMQIFKATK